VLSLSGIALAADPTPTPREKTHDRDTTATGVSSADQPTDPEADANLSVKDLPDPSNKDKDKDNTAHNDRDKTGDTLTPEDQSNDPADIKITANIRRALVGDDKLSTNAKNVKIITVGGAVTLRGTVDSEEEKTQIGEKAKAIEGIKEVKNDIEIQKS